MSDFNVLISSVSKKIPLVKKVRQALGTEGKIFGGDSDKNCIGAYFVDQFWEMPRLDKLTPDEFISYCQFHEIKAVIPTRDGELPYYAEHKGRFEQEGIHVMVSDPEAIQMSLDKITFYETINRMGYSAIETEASIDDLDGTFYVVKERYGAGSCSIGLSLTKEKASQHAESLKHPVYQPFIEGEELSIDLYVDKSGKGKGAIVRTRNLIVHGESQITTTINNESLAKACIGMAEQMGLYGHVMFQAIHDLKNDTYLMMECNARFGGASPLSLEMGLNSFVWFFQEVQGEELSPFIRSQEEKKLVRYPEDLIL